MIRKEITFENYDGEEVTEEHYFHLSKSELIDMELAEEGGLSGKLTTITQTGDGKQILEAFRNIIGKAYGIRESGSKFRKSEEISQDFLDSLAFDALFSEFLVDPNSAAAFINGVVPKDLASEPEVIQAAVAAGIPDPHKLDKSGPWPGRTIQDVNLDNASIGVGPTQAEQDKMTGLKEPRLKNGELVAWAYRHPTDTELTAMTKQQLLDAMRRRSSGWEMKIPD
jgi:hypothetical protein